MSDRVSGYCVVHVTEAKNSPAWESPYILVPLSYLKPVLPKGSTIKYPRPPHSNDELTMIQDFVQKQATPPSTWDEIHCTVENFAATYALGIELLQSIKTLKKAPRKRQVKNKQGQLEPLSKVVRKISALQKNESLSVVPDTLTTQSNLVQPVKNSDVLSDISNVQNSENQLSMSGGTVDVVSVVTLPEESLSVDQMKEKLFNVPPVLVAQTVNPGSQDHLIPNSHPSGNNHEPLISGSTPIVFENIDGVTQDSFECSNTSVSNLSETQGLVQDQYVVVSQTYLLDMERRITSSVVSSLEPKFSQIVGRSIDKKVTPRFDTVDLKLADLESTIANQESQKGKKNILSYDELKNLHELHLPLTTYDQFVKFDSRIQKNTQNLRSDLRQHLISTTAHVVKVETNVKTVLKKFIHNKLLSQFTAVKTSGTKPIFKKTAFYSCLLDAYLYVYTVDNKQTLNEDELNSLIGTRINIANGSVKKNGALNALPQSQASVQQNDLPQSSAPIQPNDGLEDDQSDDD